MANNYYEATGVLVLDRVTPVIQALFGAFALDESHPGNGQAYIAQIAETTNPQWPDVLDGLENIRVCVGYRSKDGEVLDNPVDSEGYEAVEPVYHDLPGWKESTLGARKVEDLPANARAYISYLEEQVGTSIDIISTGPDRVETIVLRNPFDS